MFQCLGLRVRKLVRVRIGSLWGGDLEPGSWRFLDDADVALLLKNPPRQRKYLGASQLVAGLPPRANRAGRTLILMKVMYLIRKILKPGILMNLLRK